jgi:DNA repair exonuclease SbcCD nuclease subunit
MKFLCFTDLHLNKFPCSNTTKDGKNELLEAGLSVIDQVYEYAMKHEFKYIFFLGDLFHIRAKIDSDIYSNMVYEKFCKYFGDKDSPNLILIPGNHDQIDKSGKHTLLPYSRIMNVTVMSDFYKHGDIIVCPHQYLVEDLYSFLQDNSNENSIVFMHQLLMNSPMMSGAIFKKNEAIDVSKFKYKLLFSGHNHRPFTNTDLGVYNVGSPMHYDFGDAECQERYFVSYDNGSVSWVETTFPHFAIHGTKEAQEASYIKKKSKKVEIKDNRVEIHFNDDPKNIMEVYVNSTGTLLDKPKLLETGYLLFKSANQGL